MTVFGPGTADNLSCIAEDTARRKLLYIGTCVDHAMLALCSLRVVVPASRGG